MPITDPSDVEIVYTIPVATTFHIDPCVRADHICPQTKTVTMNQIEFENKAAHL